MSARHLYVHLPFCASRCGYCDFVTVVGQDGRHAAYVDALLGAELALEREALAPRLESVFLGGGTPTLTEPGALERLLRALPPAEEVTVEANPETVTPELAALLRESGVTRVSLGAQSFQPRLLEVLERRARPDDVRRAFAVLREAGFDNLSLDLIYGIPGQSAADLDADLSEALALEPEHVSAYELEAKPGTRFTHAHGEELARQAEAMESYFERVVARLTGAGYRWYETANFCRAASATCARGTTSPTGGAGDYLGLGSARLDDRRAALADDAALALPRLAAGGRAAGARARGAAGAGAELRARAARPAAGRAALARRARRRGRRGRARAARAARPGRARGRRAGADRARALPRRRRHGRAARVKSLQMRNAAEIELTSRQRAILRGVVEEYVASRQPVGSRTLARARRARTSRPRPCAGELAELERLGLLTHPHTSAGRVPTERGYRYYADRLLERLDPQPGGFPLDLTTARNEVDSALQATTEMLSELTRLLALVSAPSLGTRDRAPRRGAAAPAAGRDGRRDHLDRQRHEAGLPLRRAGRPGPRRTGRRST